VESWGGVVIANRNGIGYCVPIDSETNSIKHYMKYSIKNQSGIVIFTNLSRSTSLLGYDWNDNYGHITDSTIKAEGWTVVEDGKK